MKLPVNLAAKVAQVILDSGNDKQNETVGWHKNT